LVLVGIEQETLAFGFGCENAVVIAARGQAYLKAYELRARFQTGFFQPIGVHESRAVGVRIGQDRSH
jgi:hypothetical protein